MKIKNLEGESNPIVTTDSKYIKNMEASILALFPNLGMAESMSPLEIAKAIEDVNPTLYALQKQGNLDKISEADGSKPRWRLHYIPPNSPVSGVDKVKKVSKTESLTDIILAFITSHKTPVSEFEIFVNTIQPKDQGVELSVLTDMVCSALESLSNQGKIIQLGNPDELTSKWETYIQ